MDWSFKRVWARREFYTARIRQARFDLASSPLEPGGSIFTSVAIEGPAISPAYVAGAFVISPQSGAAMAETHYRLLTVWPFATVEADFHITASEHGSGMIEWMSGDGQQRITVAAKRHSGMIASELVIAGAVVASVPDVPADLDGDFTLIAQLQGRSVLAWHRRGGVTTYLGRLDFASHLDLRASGTFTDWTVGITARGHSDMIVRCSRFESSLSGNGHADPRLVAYEDGSLIQDGSRVFFLATTRGSQIPDSFQGIYSLDISSGDLTMTGALFGDRGDGIWHNDNAGHLLFDRDTRLWTWFAIGHSDHPHARGSWVGSSPMDLRHGISHVPVAPVSLPEGHLWEDVYVFRDGQTWLATASKNARQTAWMQSSDGVAGPWIETRTAVGDNETGQIMVSSGARRYLVAGTTTADYIVRDGDSSEMSMLGHLDVDLDTGGRRIWPALFRVQEPSGPRWFMLSFDRTALAEAYSYGRLHFYRQA